MQHLRVSSSGNVPGSTPPNLEQDPEQELIRIKAHELDKLPDGFYQIIWERNYLLVEDGQGMPFKTYDLKRVDPEQV
jgi:hypothetical protein